MIRSSLLFGCFCLLGMSAASARADALVVGGLTYADVTITAVKDGQVVFTVRASGAEVRRPIAQISRINMADEPALNSAEEAYAARNWDKATDNYEKALRATQREWLREWIPLRLLDSANKGGRFDAAVRAYIALAEKSPDSARAISLNMPKPDSAYLPEAIKLVDSAINRNRNDATREVLLNLLVELNEARNDVQGAQAAMDRRLQLKAADSSTAEGARAATVLKLKEIGLALAARQFDKVIELVQKDADSFTEPQDVAEVLLALADARAGKAADSKDAEVWKEVALAYMRVPANCPQSAPQVPDALLKTARILETRLNDRDAAVRMYQQVASEYAGQPPAAEAKKEMDRLKR